MRLLIWIHVGYRYRLTTAAELLIQQLRGLYSPIDFCDQVSDRLVNPTRFRFVRQGLAPISNDCNAVSVYDDLN
jgi:hypothetical protein